VLLVVVIIVVVGVVLWVEDEELEVLGDEVELWLLELDGVEDDEVEMGVVELEELED
jgi:hypothetical protein